MRQKRNVWFILRREPYYHKLQYSKTPKFDPAAAIFGVTLGAFVAYLTLSTVGSGGSDLTDLTITMWYTFLIFYIIKTWLFLQKNAKSGKQLGFKLWIAFFVEVFSMLKKKTKLQKKTK